MSFIVALMDSNFKSAEMGSSSVKTDLKNKFSFSAASESDNSLSSLVK